MGYVTCMGRCAVCGGLMSFNPVRVPSITIKGNREPVCQSCMARINALRKEKGLEEFPVLPDAYEACDENEL